MKIFFEIALFVCATALIVFCAACILGAQLARRAFDSIPRIGGPAL
jgi:hypothetical protein